MTNTWKPGGIGAWSQPHLSPILASERAMHIDHWTFPAWNAFARAISLLALVPALLCGTARAPASEDDSYLWPHFHSPEGEITCHCEAYVPHEGDLIFYSDNNRFWRFLYLLAWTGPPYHCGIVTRLPDGRPAVLEAGPYDYVHVYLMDVLPRLHTHRGRIWVRRLRVPLTPEQSTRLTQFALAQTGKRYGVLRIVREVTPFRSHGALHAPIFGSSRTDYQRWFCSEQVMAAAAVAGLIDPRIIQPNTVYPRDLFLDRPHDLSDRWEIPVRWTDTPNPPPYDSLDRLISDHLQHP